MLHGWKRFAAALWHRLGESPRAWLVFVALFAIVRGAHLAHSWSDPLLKSAAQYDYLAQLTVRGAPWLNWMEGGDWQFGPVGTPTAVRTPTLPLFLAAIYRVVGYEPQLARVALVLVNALAAGALFQAARRLWGFAPAVLVALAWTFWPVSVRALYYVDSILGESLAIPLLIVALWALTYDRLRTAVCAGLALGAAILARPHLALTVPVAVVLAVVAFRGAARQARNLVLICAVVSCLCVLPWAARNYLTMNAFMPLSSQSGLALWIGWAKGTSGSWDDQPHEKALVRELAERNPELMTAPEPVKSKIYAKAAVEAMKERGALGIVQRAVWKAWLHIRPWETFYGLHSALLLATILVGVAGRSLWSTPANVLATSICIGLLLTSVVTFYLGRYRFVSTPALLLLAGGGIARLIHLKRSGTLAEKLRDLRPRTLEQRTG